MFLQVYYSLYHKEMSLTKTGLSMHGALSGPCPSFCTYHSKISALAECVRVLRSCYQDHGHMETMPAQKVNLSDRDSIPVSLDTMMSNHQRVDKTMPHTSQPSGWQVHWWSGKLVNPSYSPITKSIRTQMAAILV